MKHQTLKATPLMLIPRENSKTFWSWRPPQQRVIAFLKTLWMNNKLPLWHTLLLFINKFMENKTIKQIHKNINMHIMAPPYPYVGYCLQRMGCKPIRFPCNYCCLSSRRFYVLTIIVVDTFCVKMITQKFFKYAKLW